MANSFNHLDPMNKSIYLEAMLPSSTIDETLAHSPYLTHYPATAAGPNSPKLAPQPTKDSFYYKNDGVDDGKISGFEKFKAFLKGGTYNMIRGMFCDKDGFSITRTLLTAGAIGAIALTGPIGAAVAGGIGLIAAATNFVKSASMANKAVTDKQAREAYEGFGEGTTTAALSLWGGFKGLQALKNNFANTNATMFQKLTKWKLPNETPVPERPIPEEPVAEEPIVEEPVVENPVEEVTPVAEDTPIQQDFGPGTWKLPPVEEFIEKPAPELSQLPKNPPRALPSPEMVRARMEADGQLNFPAIRQNIELEPIEYYYGASEPKYNIPIENGKVKVRISRKPRKSGTSPKKLEIIEGSRDLIRKQLGEKTAQEYMPSFERSATRQRVKILPEIFQYIREFRAQARAQAKAENGGVLPKEYKDPMEYTDALDLYKVVQNKNTGFIRGLMKEGKYTIKDMVKLVKDAKREEIIQRKYNPPQKREVDVKKVDTSNIDVKYSSGTEPVGKVPPEVEKAEVFPEGYPTGK